MTSIVQFIIDEDNKNKLAITRLPSSLTSGEITKAYGSISMFYKKWFFILGKPQLIPTGMLESNIVTFVLRHSELKPATSAFGLISKQYEITYSLYLLDKQISTHTLIADKVKEFEYLIGVITRHFYIPKVYAKTMELFKNPDFPKDLPDYLHTIPRYTSDIININWIWTVHTKQHSVNKDITTKDLDFTSLLSEIIIWFNIDSIKDEKKKHFIKTIHEIFDISDTHKFSIDPFIGYIGLYDLVFGGFLSMKEYPKENDQVNTFLFGRKFLQFFLDYNINIATFITTMYTFLNTDNIKKNKNLEDVIYVFNSFSGRGYFTDFKVFFIGSYDEDVVTVLLYNIINPNENDPTRKKLFEIYKNNKPISK